jgi:hypothetical protein
VFLPAIGLGAIVVFVKFPPTHTGWHVRLARSRRFGNTLGDMAERDSDVGATQNHPLVRNTAAWSPNELSAIARFSPIRRHAPPSPALREKGFAAKESPSMSRRQASLANSRFGCRRRARG